MLYPLPLWGDDMPSGIEVDFCTFNKKVNSTKAPPESAFSQTFTCTLKDETSIINPTIYLDWAGHGTNFDPYDFNYCRIGYFDRYYFIKDWVCIRNNYWCAHLSIDVLASWSVDIGLYNGYILRCASKCNPAIIDDMYPVTTKVTSWHDIARQVNFSYPAWASNTPWKVSYSTGMYVIGILNSDSGTADGAVNYYMFTPSQFNTFKSILLGSGSYAAGDFSGIEISAGLWKSLFNPIQYITTCRWFPIAPDDSGLNKTLISSLKFGWWEFDNCECYKLNSLTWDSGHFCFRPPDHPQNGNDTNVPLPLQFLNFSPYTEATLYVPPFGTFKIRLDELGYKEYSGNALHLFRYLRCNIRVDFISGQGSLIVTVYERQQGSTPSDTLLSTLLITNTTISVDVVIGQISTNAMGVAGGLAQTVSGAVSAVSGNPLGILSSLGGVMSALNASIPTATQIGSSGSIVDYQTTIFTIEYEYHHIVERNPAEIGYPFYANEQINNLSGYIKTANADIEFQNPVGMNEPATFEEVALIREYMNGGFFYE